MATGLHTLIPVCVELSDLIKLRRSPIATGVLLGVHTPKQSKKNKLNYEAL